MRKPISEIINSVTSDKPFVSLFCGSCTVEALINTNKRIINDKQPYIAAMWNAVINGYRFPKDVYTKEDHKLMKEKWLAGEVSENEYPECAFLMTCYSMFGRWGATYYRNVYKKDSTREYNGMKNIYKRAEQMRGNTTVLNLDYMDVPIPPESVVFADPPYMGVSNNVWGLNEEFDHNQFWEYMETLVNAGHVVFVTECKAPPQWKKVYSKVKKKLSVIKNTKDGSKPEYGEYEDCMFMHQSQIHLIRGC
jgi:site-specific DNA-adenine methylase